MIVTHTCNPGPEDVERPVSEVLWPTSLEHELAQRRYMMVLEVSTLASIYTHALT